MHLLEANFRLEFINRIDEIVTFHPLRKEHLVGIVDIKLRHVLRCLADKGYCLEVTEAASEYLAKAGYNPDFGARPLKSLIHRERQDPLALTILAGEFKEGEVIRVDRSPEGLIFSAVLSVGEEAKEA